MKNLAAGKTADRPDAISGFSRWQDPEFAFESMLNLHAAGRSNQVYSLLWAEAASCGSSQQGKAGAAARLWFLALTGRRTQVFA
ncbi:hypothetical protein [Massilia mucilaginosa]|uniref:hypothetical protein n=1 Tax=Massilia mucilaginosa TaxID=2609282 RepID=UPI0014206F5E|nr:hypothetical protein [Massilia mucilaginosa]